MPQTIFQEKNLGKAIATLAFPAMLGQLTTLIYNIADTYFVSLTGNPSQIAAVTLCAPLLLIIMSIGSIFGAGGSSLIARLLGQKAENTAREAASFCIYTMLAISIAVVLIGIFLLSPFVHLLGADRDNAGFTADYLIYIFYGAPFIMFGNGMLHIFRAAGLIRQGTFGLILGNLANVVLDYVFIIIFDMGTAGAALATSLGFLLTSGYYLVCIARSARQKQHLLTLSPRAYHPTASLAVQILAIGIPGALITVLMSLSNIVLNNYISIYGSNAVAAYGIAFKINSIAVMLSVGLSQGVAPLLGYCCGAGEIKRLQKVMNLSVVSGVIMGLFFTFIFFTARYSLVQLFLSDEEHITQAGLFLCILCSSAPVLGILNMITGYFQAAGKAIPSLLITCLKNIGLFIPVVILFNQSFQLNGIIAAQPFVEYLVSAFCLGLYLFDLSRYQNVPKDAAPRRHRSILRRQGI